VRGYPVAIKYSRLDPPGEVDGVRTKAFKREKLVLSRLNHPGCLKKDRCWTFGDAGVIVTRLMRGTLKEVIEDEMNGDPMDGWSPSKKTICAIGIAFALEYIHGVHFIHRDLKMENVFVNEDLEPVIGDFGLTRAWGLGTCADTSDLTMAIGTPLHMAPETYAEGNFYDLSIDVYAYAVLLYFFWADSNCFRLDDPKGVVHSKEDHMKRIGQGARFVRVPDIPDIYWDLITRGWSHAPSSRPLPKDIVDAIVADPHQWMLPDSDPAEVIDYIERMKTKRP
jgi:serine/threonine protein kinase